MRLTAPKITTVDSSGSTESGVYRSVQFLLSSDFEGTIAGATMDAASWAVIPFEAPKGEKLDSIAYTVTAGSLQIITTA